MNNDNNCAKSEKEFKEFKEYLARKIQKNNRSILWLNIGIAISSTISVLFIIAWCVRMGLGK